MINTAMQRLDRSVRLMGPFFVSIILVMLSALPVYVPGYGQIAVDVGLVTVFYWAIYRPGSVSRCRSICPGSVARYSGGFAHRSACVDPVACELGDCLPADLFSGQGVWGDLVEFLAGCRCCCGTVMDSRLCVKHDLYQPACRVVPNVADDRRVPVHGLVPSPGSACNSASHRY